jgi:hypothetical protein
VIRASVSRTFIVAIAAAFSFGGLCGPGAEPPPPDSCSSPSQKAITSVELGPEMLPERDFEPWASADTAYVTHGLQGGDMIGTSLRLSGDAPACLQQKTVIKSGGSVIAEETSPLNTYAQVDGTRWTKTTWLVFEGVGPPIGTPLQIVTTAGGKTVTADITVAADRNKLESITITPATPHAYQDVVFELKTRIAPPYTGFTPAFIASDPLVLSILPPSYIYDATTTWTGQARAAGESDCTVKYASQMISTHVVVTPTP